MSFGIARRPTGDDQIGGVHGLPRVCGRLSGERYAQPVATENSGACCPACEVACLGCGCGDRGAVLWRRRICQDRGLLGFVRAASDLSATGSQCGSGYASDAGRELARVERAPSPAAFATLLITPKVDS